VCSSDLFARVKGILFFVSLGCFAIYALIDVGVAYVFSLDAGAPPLEAVYYAVTDQLPIVVGMVCAVLAPGFARRTADRFGSVKSATTDGRGHNVIAIGEEERKRKIRSWIDALRRSAVSNVCLPVLHDAWAPLLVFVFSVLEIKLTMFDLLNDWSVMDYVFLGAFAALILVATAMLFRILFYAVLEAVQED
jgi:hypothetical protein